ncbi:MAG TPA: hypothetical protein VGR56_02655 [Nitrososphaerales archaeon]|nr:hypothetical protein [Nitrososphaerales archaeon]
MRKAQRGRVLFVLGIFLLIFGAYVSLFPLSFPPHLRVYFAVTDSSVTLLETTVEYAIPLAGIQPYIQNLTLGNRILEISAYLKNQLVLNESYSNLGTGYDVIRTNNFAMGVAAGSNISVIARLIGSGRVLATQRTTTIASPSLLWIAAGVSSIGLALWLVATNLMYIRRPKASSKKTRSRTYQGSSVS